MQRIYELFLEFRESLMREGKSRGAVLWPYSRLSTGQNLPEFLVARGVEDPRGSVDALVEKGKILRTPWRGPSGRKGVLLTPAPDALAPKGGRRRKTATAGDPRPAAADLESIVMEVLRRLKA